MTRAEAARVLGVPPHARPEEIEAAFRALAARTHPDRGGSSGTFEAAVEARAVLRGTAPSPARRAPAPVVGATASALRRRRWGRATRRLLARVGRVAHRPG